MIQKLYFKTPALISSSVLAGLFSGIFTELISTMFEVLLSIRQDFLGGKVIFLFLQHQGTGLRPVVFHSEAEHHGWMGKENLVPAESKVCSCSAAKVLSPLQSTCRYAGTCLNN